jgi:hypothetical protein
MSREGQLNKEIEMIRNDQKSLSPSKGSQVHFKASPSIPGIFSNGSDRGHTSSYRSLYVYGSRSNILFQAEDEKLDIRKLNPPEKSESSEEINEEDFSNFLTLAAHKPSFLSRSGRKTRIEANYENYYLDKKNPPKLPPRDFDEINDFKLKQSLDFTNSDDRRLGEYSKSQSSRFQSKYGLDEEEKFNRREADREKRISVLDNVDQDAYYP